MCNALESICEACGPVGKGCALDADCCAGLTCDPTTRQCKAGSACLASGASCTTSPQCCGPLVCNAFYDACQSCGGAGVACNGDDDCCSSLHCNTGSHQCEASDAATCGPSGTLCSWAADCCQGLYCDYPLGADGGAKSCTPTPTCKRVHDPCTTYADCCEGAADMDCAPDASVCCISPAIQDPNEIRCYQSSDCCTGTCNVATGQCQP